MSEDWKYKGPRGRRDGAPSLGLQVSSNHLYGPEEIREKSPIFLLILDAVLGRRALCDVPSRKLTAPYPAERRANRMGDPSPN